MSGRPFQTRLKCHFDYFIRETEIHLAITTIFQREKNLFDIYKLWRNQRKLIEMPCASVLSAGRPHKSGSCCWSKLSRYMMNFRAKYESLLFTSLPSHISNVFHFALRAVTWPKRWNCQGKDDDTEFQFVSGALRPEIAFRFSLSSQNCLCIYLLTGVEPISRNVPRIQYDSLSR